jgi:hypothetical protein
MHQWSTIVIYRYYVILIFDPKFVPRFGLTDRDYLESDHVPTINGQQLLVSKIDFLLTPMQTDRQTIFSYDPPYSRGNKKIDVSNFYNGF